MTKEPVWNVYIQDFNKNEIRIFNVFNSYKFHEGCKKALKQYKKDKDFNKLNEELKSWAMYAFWSKCEYEIILSGWPHHALFQEKKIDVWDQLSLNWEYFVKYILDNVSVIMKKEN